MGLGGGRGWVGGLVVEEGGGEEVAVERVRVRLCGWLVYFCPCPCLCLVLSSAPSLRLSHLISSPLFPSSLATPLSLSVSRLWFYVSVCVRAIVFVCVWVAELFSCHVLQYHVAGKRFCQEERCNQLFFLKCGKCNKLFVERRRATSLFTTRFVSNCKFVARLVFQQWTKIVLQNSLWPDVLHAACCIRRRLAFFGRFSAEERPALTKKCFHRHRFSSKKHKLNSDRAQQFKHHIPP